MPALVIQLSDLHARSSNNPIKDKWGAVCRTILTELHDITHCVIAFCGDAAWSGKKEEFDIAQELLHSLKTEINEKFPDLAVSIITIPGNHDCDFSEDQTARNTLRNNLKAELPSVSVKRVLLEPQQHYFLFSKSISAKQEEGITVDNPFYNHVDIKVDGNVIRFHLINSSWTSVLRETNDLRFPLSELTPPKFPTADFAITMIHHPYHWFLQPEVRRELRDCIEANSDLVLTGHEHENESSQRTIDKGLSLSYLEGGVLQESDRPSLCKFNTVRIDFQNSSRLVRKYYWAGDHFEVEGEPQSELLMVNSLRRDRRLRLKKEFERYLDELDDLVNHPRISDIRLSQIYSYPDLRRHEGARQESSDVDSQSSSGAVWIRSDRVYGELINRRSCLIIGGDKAGKTSLSKKLFLEFHRTGKAPLFIRGRDVPKNCTNENLQRTITKALAEQYQELSFEQYSQLADNKILFLDDLQDCPNDHQSRSRMLRYFAQGFDQVFLLASNEFYLEILSEHRANPTDLVSYTIYDICDFGQARLHDLAGRWIKLRNPDATMDQLNTTVGDLCDKVELVLATAGLPHTPWLLVVLIENAGSFDAGNAKNGAYGKLYEAVITVALTKSQIKSPDIDGKYLYLARFAFFLHTLRKATISDADARTFHNAHCRDYDWTISYEKMRDDLVAIKILRQDGDAISFRVKYLYCYFVAHWLQRNIHTEDARQEIQKLGQRLHHDISSNVLVMLASLTQDPIVLKEMLTGSAALFSSNKPAEMTSEILKLNQLQVPENILALPSTSPEINRQLLREAHDEANLGRANEDHDGRLIQSIPKEEDVDSSDPTVTVTKEIRQIRAAVRTMDILGQVLRNGAASQTAEDKLAIMHEIVMLGRRVLDHFYGYLEHFDEMCQFTEGMFSKIISRSEEHKISTDGLSRDDASARSAGSANAEEQARLLSNRFWFELYAMGSAGIIKRMGTIIGIKALDPTLDRLLVKDSSVANNLVRFQTKLNRREQNVPADDIVDFHGQLKYEGNRLARIILELMVFERLLMYETYYRDAQKLCSSMNIKRIPSRAYDPNVKRFSPRA